MSMDKTYLLTPKYIVQYPKCETNKGLVRGSSAYCACEEYPFYEKIPKKPRKEKKKFVLDKIIYEDEKAQNIPVEISDEEKRGKALRYCENNEEKVYKLNKSKVREKLWAFFNLEQSKKFGAFYSVSFPLYKDAKKTILMDEDTIFSIWHNFLVNLRKTYKLRDYLWVTEYQKNGNIHFHMCVNVFMDIVKVNASMKKNLKNHGIENVDSYNGVDVEFMRGDRRKIMAYITKYISKQACVTFKHLPWHCSRLISRLFTKIELDEETYERIKSIWEEIGLQFKEGLTKFTHEYVCIEIYNQPIGKDEWCLMPKAQYNLIMELNNNMAVELAKKPYKTPTITVRKMLGCPVTLARDVQEMKLQKWWFRRMKQLGLHYEKKVGNYIP